MTRQLLHFFLTSWSTSSMNKKSTLCKVQVEKSGCCIEIIIIIDLNHFVQNKKIYLFLQHTGRDDMRSKTVYTFLQLLYSLVISVLQRSINNKHQIAHIALRVWCFYCLFLLFFVFLFLSLLYKLLWTMRGGWWPIKRAGNMLLGVVMVVLLLVLLFLLLTFDYPLISFKLFCIAFLYFNKKKLDKSTSKQAKLWDLDRN